MSAKPLPPSVVVLGGRARSRAPHASSPRPSGGVPARFRVRVSTWRLYDATGTGAPSLVATGSSDGRRRVLDRVIWDMAAGDTP